MCLVCGMWVVAVDARCDEVGMCVAGYMDLEADGGVGGCDAGIG